MRARSMTARINSTQFTLLCCLALNCVLLRRPVLAANSPSLPSPHVVFVIGENEYHTWETLPEFACKELAAQRLTSSFVMASPKEHDNNFTNFAAIKDADLLFISVRRRTPPTEMMSLIRAHLAAGKPLLGIRTASHAFGADPPDNAHEGWRTFDRDILGCSYQDHYNNTGTNAPATLVQVLPDRPHPILTGIPAHPLRVTSHLYKSRDLGPTATAACSTLRWAAWTISTNPSSADSSSMQCFGRWAGPCRPRLPPHPMPSKPPLPQRVQE